MDFRSDLPISEKEQNYQKLDEIYEELQAHPGEWTVVNNDMLPYPDQREWYGFNYLFSLNYKRWQHAYCKEIDGTAYVRYVAPKPKVIKQHRSIIRKYSAELILAVSFTVISLIVYLMVTYV